MVNEFKDPLFDFFFGKVKKKKIALHTGII